MGRILSEEDHHDMGGDGVAEHDLMISMTIRYFDPLEGESVKNSSFLKKWDMMHKWHGMGVWVAWSLV